ncbi:hypothetical protein AWB67_05696 [Caballeronia terrestris]|uniref:Uncharacterized protein n=1 Tax=Caballeronia terrestris TaxID=1226301 RepID=A0A158KI64_9BURK|nr:hypothetical protein AWB67_05696 [Caballeronia terrestris]
MFWYARQMKTRISLDGLNANFQQIGFLQAQHCDDPQTCSTARLARLSAVPRTGDRTLSLQSGMSSISEVLHGWRLPGWTAACSATI